MKLKNLFAMAALTLLAAACSNDDEPKTATSLGGEAKTNLDVTAYDKWTYINLKTGDTKQYDDTSAWIYTDGTETPAKDDANIDMEWHIAIHRYEIKTNNGEAYDTKQQDFNSVTSLPANVTWTKDQVVSWESQQAENVASPLEVITDMTKMMQGSVGYSKEPSVNTVLCNWVNKVETGSMPPVVYTPTKNVLVVKFADGSWTKLQFTAAGNTETNKSGYVTFNYEFFSID